MSLLLEKVFFLPPFFSPGKRKSDVYLIMKVRCIFSFYHTSVRVFKKDKQQLQQNTNKTNTTNKQKAKLLIVRKLKSRVSEILY